MPQNFTENFYGPEGTQRALAAPGGAPRGAQPTRVRQPAPGAPWWVVPPSRHPEVQPGPVVFLLAHKNSP